MKPVQERPPLPQASPVTFGGLVQFTGSLTKQLISLLQEYGYRLNRVLPKDGTEPMTGDLDMDGHNILNSGLVSNTAYDATSWNGVTTIAPSKNAIRDKFETLGTASVEDIGTSGATLGLLNASKTDSGANTFSGNNTLTGTNILGNFTSAGGTDGARFTASQEYKLSFSNAGTSALVRIDFRNDNAIVGSITTDGSNTAYNTTSDERLKDGFDDFDSGAIVDAIKIYKFNWRSDGKKGYGPKAQELYQVFPEAVTPGSSSRDEEFVPWGWDASKLVPLLIKELQSLRRRISTLEGAK